MQWGDGDGGGGEVGGGGCGGEGEADWCMHIPRQPATQPRIA